jgi:hypothetical protein
MMLMLHLSRRDYPGRYRCVDGSSFYANAGYMCEECRLGVVQMGVRVCAG